MKRDSTPCWPSFCVTGKVTARRQMIQVPDGVSKNPDYACKHSVAKSQGTKTCGIVFLNHCDLTADWKRREFSKMISKSITQFSYAFLHFKHKFPINAIIILLLTEMHCFYTMKKKHTIKNCYKLYVIKIFY